jgi:clan AA aspartic protease (TIGR02281 family)
MTKSAFALAIAIVVAFAISAGAIAAVDPSDWYMGYRVISEVPFAEVPEGMAMNVLVNGKPVPAIWDTGAAGMHFSRAQLAKRGVDVSGARSAGLAVGVDSSSLSYEFDAQVVVGREIANIPVSFTEANSSSPYGLIGQDFFGRYVYEVDPSAKVIRFLKKTAVVPGRSDTQARGDRFKIFGEPFRWYQGLIYVTAIVNGKPTGMIFDTGAMSIGFSDKQLAAIGARAAISGGRTSGLGGSSTSYAANIGTVVFGPATANNVAATVIPHGASPAPLLGQSFLKQMRYIIDPERQIIRIRPR